MALPPVAQKYHSRQRLSRALSWGLIVVGVLALIWAYHEYRFEPRLDRLPIRLLTNKTSYTLGEPVYYAVQNDTRQLLKIENECPNEPLTVYFWDGAAWQQQRAEDAAANCQAEPREIRILPDTLVGSSYQAWASLFTKAGRYRLDLSLEGYRGTISQEITISN